MHAIFTGSSRRLRQVDLSGRRVTNPWASSSGSISSGNAVATAQQERQRRVHEQAKLAAAKGFQRRWRGIQSRRLWREHWRQAWDQAELACGEDAVAMPYGSFDELLQQTNLLLMFFNVGVRHDRDRLIRLLSRQASTPIHATRAASNREWKYTFLRLQRLIVAVIESDLTSNVSATRIVLTRGLASNLLVVPGLTTVNASIVFQLLASLLQALAGGAAVDRELLHEILRCMSALLTSTPVDAAQLYEAFVGQILSSSDLCKVSLHPTVLDSLASMVDLQETSEAVLRLYKTSNSSAAAATRHTQEHALVLAHILYLHQRKNEALHAQAAHPNTNFVPAVSLLLSLVAADRSGRLAQGYSQDDENDQRMDSDDAHRQAFVQTQMMTLIENERIMEALGAGNTDLSPTTDRGERYAKQIASFALTLLRIFPNKADDIRMQLYRGSTALTTNGNSKQPAILYFWHTAKDTFVLRTVVSKMDSVIALLKADSDSDVVIDGVKKTRKSIQDDWRVILIFLELYIFVLRVMDDEEFLSRAPTGTQTSNKSWASQNALSFEDIMLLTQFLKSMGFVMYYNASALSYATEASRSQPASLSQYFGLSSSRPEAKQITPEVKEQTVAGMTGVVVEYAKLLVTNLLRMLYERDSRRPFLPKDHWLMTSHLRMDGFISSVVEEDENRRRYQEDEEQLVEEEEPEEDERENLIGSSRVSRLRRQQNLQIQQRRLAKRRFLAGITPRLEIMQHMPFFIPFETRVEIFREFVKLDQAKRRRTNAMTDWDQWRFSGMGNPEASQRHHASIRRDRVFMDAFDHFWSLGEGLKEPIQITFIDAYNNEEAGIDGGGVTKEFLTSIIQETFQPKDADAASAHVQMFVENHEHKLYPNPTALEETQEILRRSRTYSDLSTQDTLERMQEQDLLKKYEFIGRIIGKCLYEGILVDVTFAGFFLLKWALAGGDDFASRKTRYRANFNELRDMDEELYRGLLQLKNYPGDVKDFDLDFTINDQIVYDHETGAHVTKTTNLRPFNPNEPVSNANRLLYISYVAAHRLQVQPSRQTAAFLQGLSSMIQPRWLNMFNQSELQTLVGGTSASIDVADLRDNTECSGVFQPGDVGEHHTISLFWEVMTEFDDEQRRALLKFVTSTPRAPLLGFKTLYPRFTIRDSGSDQTRLPSSSTCVNLLKMPMYSSKKVLRDKLLLAIFSGAGFDLS